ncbi:OprF [Aliidiomarina shirensis]|uniref:OprF n=1 Tax=Aliidiomarina shirensis TaxID=1048642 RepID=A0A432WQM3_9GAMM|nr:OmpA family protein [Aliidiomarina shirensis]RUO36029.1 OprF [Aliidiomarina shirensis]
MNKITGIAIPAAIAGLMLVSPQAKALENFTGTESFSFGARLNITSIDGDRIFVDNANIGHFIDDGFNSPQIGLEFSVPLTDRWAVRTYWDRVKTDVEGLTNSATGHMFGTDALFFLNENVYAGAGFNATRVQRHRDLMYRATLGYRHSFNEKWFIRAEVAPQFSSDYNDISFIVSANYRFGEGGPALNAWLNRDEREAAATQDTTPAETTDRETDSDRDGVPDYRDDCANTPRNHVVDSRGCTVYTTEQVSENLRVGFEFDSARVTSDYNGDVRRLADFMKEHTDTEVVINGHTDLIGTAEYNRDLSERRAKAVADILVNSHGISRSRITTVGHGMSRPVVNEISLSANERNRRTEAALSVEIRVPRTR